MPLYSYKCDKCEHLFDAIHGYNDPKPKCPECEAEEVTKQVSSASFDISGAGVYKPGLSVRK